jgi:hypothetical protein
MLTTELTNRVIAAIDVAISASSLPQAGNNNMKKLSHNNDTYETE